jgi:hypothetical protein
MTRSNTAAPKRTAITVSAVADCPPVIAEDHAVDFLHAAEAGGSAFAIRLPWLPWVRHRVDIAFGLHFDLIEHGRPHDEIRIRWSSGSALLPDFRGTIRFRSAGEKTSVLLDGSYVAPLGIFGAAFDRLAGREIARASLTDLAVRIAGYLTRCQQSWLAGLRPAGAG